MYKVKELIRVTKDGEVFLSNKGLELANKLAEKYASVDSDAVYWAKYHNAFDVNVEPTDNEELNEACRMRLGGTARKIIRGEIEPFIVEDDSWD